MALVSGAAAPAFVHVLGSPPGIEVKGPLEGTWRLRAADHRTLCDALGAVTRPPGRLRIEVDPLRS
jgi:primosomal protein N' (replication factor Y)